MYKLTTASKNVWKSVGELRVDYDVLEKDFCIDYKTYDKMIEKWDELSILPLGEPVQPRRDTGVHGGCSARSISADFVCAESMNAWIEFVEELLEKEESYLDLVKKKEEEDKAREAEVEKINAQIEAEKIAKKVLNDKPKGKGKKGADKA